MAVEGTRMRFTTERYERMVEAGVLTSDDRVELIRGEIVEMTPISSEHSTVVRRIVGMLQALLGDRVCMGVQSPIRLPPDSEPEPDLWLAMPPDDRYLRRHPGPDDLLLVVEVAHSSHPRDRVKIPLYGVHGIREAWLVDIPACRIEVHSDPGSEGYRQVGVVPLDASVAPGAFPDASVEAEALFRGLD